MDFIPFVAHPARCPEDTVGLGQIIAVAEIDVPAEIEIVPAPVACPGVFAVIQGLQDTAVLLLEQGFQQLFIAAPQYCWLCLLPASRLLLLLYRRGNTGYQFIQNGLAVLDWRIEDGVAGHGEVPVLCIDLDVIRPDAPPAIFKAISGDDDVQPCPGRTFFTV